MKKIISFLIVGSFLYSCYSHHEESKKHSKHRIFNPIKSDTTLVKDYVCQIHSIKNIELRAIERGYLNRIWVDEGQFVKKGQSMFKVMPNLYEAEFQKAEAEASLAKIEYENTKRLANSQIVSKNEMAMAKAKYDIAKADVKIAKTHLDFTEIKAPFDGIMDHLHVREGSLLEEGELLTTLSDNSKMWVYFNVPEAEYLDYANYMNKPDKQEVRILMANNKIFKHKGYIETIEGEFNNETGNIAFRATFPNPEGLLRHGETGSILINIPYEKALIIPQKATFKILDKTFVFVLDKNNILHHQEITIDAELPHVFIVKDGLKETDRVLLDGIRLVKEGDYIESQLIPSDTILSSLELYAE